jgi:hypothetical protein
VEFRHFPLKQFGNVPPRVGGGVSKTRHDAFHQIFSTFGSGLVKKRARTQLFHFRHLRKKNS